MFLGEYKELNLFNLVDDDVESKLDMYYSCYGHETKYFINSLLTCVVISSSVENISAMDNINNVFVDSIIEKKWV
ncbi:hypothetical protein EON71_00920 [bacterium]|nr:MAG: hypothetical protein EON71_00920 [bacterium]